MSNNAILARHVFHDLESDKKNVGFIFCDLHNEESDWVGLTQEELMALTPEQVVKLVAEHSLANHNPVSIGIFEESACSFGIQIGGDFVEADVVGGIFEQARKELIV